MRNCTDIGAGNAGKPPSITAALSATLSPICSIRFLNWDSKFFATIALLILKPWKLTNEFLAGKRVRYVNPLRLYLLASILFFFAVNYRSKRDSC